jgi:predicted nucleotidyltransferase
MGLSLSQMASELGCSERTLRRYFNEGLVRGERRGGRKEVWTPPSEELYLRRHWELLSALRGALRTEPSVSLAVLFGSTAIGEERPDSDVDLLIDDAAGGTIDALRLQRRLRERVGKEVHLVLLQDAEGSPDLLADVLGEGRVIVNRGHAWDRLLARRRQTLDAADAESQATHAAAWRAIDEARERLGA